MTSFPSISSNVINKMENAALTVSFLGGHLCTAVQNCLDKVENRLNKLENLFKWVEANQKR